MHTRLNEIHFGQVLHIFSVRKYAYNVIMLGGLAYIGRVA